MSSFECNCRCSCTLYAAIASAFIGVIAAFLQITGVITVTPAFLWVALGIAVVYLAVLLSTTHRTAEGSRCGCSSLNALLIGILGTALFSVILLAVGVIATSVVSTILVGLLLFFLSLILTATACHVKYLNDCED